MVVLVAAVVAAVCFCFLSIVVGGVGGHGGDGVAGGGVCSTVCYFVGSLVWVLLFVVLVVRRWRE